MLSGYFKITSLLDAILLPTWLHFGSPNPPKSRPGGVLGRLGGVLVVSWGVSGVSWSVLEASWGVLERLRTVLERLGAVLGASWSRLGVAAALESAPIRQQPSGPSR